MVLLEIAELGIFHDYGGNRNRICLCHGDQFFRKPDYIINAIIPLRCFACKVVQGFFSIKGFPAGNLGLGIYDVYLFPHRFQQR